MRVAYALKLEPTLRTYLWDVWQRATTFPRELRKHCLMVFLCSEVEDDLPDRHPLSYESVAELCRNSYHMPRCDARSVSLAVKRWKAHPLEGYDGLQGLRYTPGRPVLTVIAPGKRKDRPQGTRFWRVRTSKMKSRVSQKEHERRYFMEDSLAMQGIDALCVRNGRTEETVPVFPHLTK